MVALYQYFGFDIPIEERFSMIKAAGFDAVGVWCDDWFGWTGHREFPKLARKAGLEVIDGHAPFARDFELVNSIWIDNQNGEAALDIYLRTICECGEDGIKNLIVHIQDEGCVPPNELGIERIKRLVGAAEKNNVTVTLENITDHSYLSYVFDRIDSPKLGFCYDIGHRNANENSVDLLKLFGYKLKALHLHDNDGSGDQHLIPFTAGINWPEQMTKIAETGYTGPITLECTVGGPGSTTTDDLRTPDQWLDDAFKAAKRLEELKGK